MITLLPRLLTLRPCQSCPLPLLAVHCKYRLRRLLRLPEVSSAARRQELLLLFLLRPGLADSIAAHRSFPPVRRRLLPLAVVR
ncbi:hypothetical protein IWZ03DRAFT_366972 [Phyllosticta citriasiana]|uniref:Secreted protein n=1 Tax=Phyllosticta citriasiana TaxID=595635 RepID=A0ABR1L086_9PEZI